MNSQKKEIKEAIAAGRVALKTADGVLAELDDADGLNTLAKMDLSILKDAKAPVILTPHLMEFSRLSGLSIEQIEADPISCAKTFAKEYGVILLLKGCCTAVTDGEVVYLCNRGGAGMATAGSGDVLSGVLAGLHGFVPVSARSVACGAYLAGRAGELAEKESTSISMTASDTVARLPDAVREILNGNEKKEA